ncbi:homocysteine S-methyltransferase family protein [Petrachloros mirabilis]
MARYRNNLPQLQGGLYLTDGGIETTLIFHEGIDLPDFAAFDLMNRPGGEKVLRDYYRTYAALAKKFHAGMILESATWRASADWGRRLGYSRERLSDANRRSIKLLEEIRAEFEDAGTNVVISGCIGPRGDGYSPGDMMSEQNAEAYHRDQIETFAETDADMITALTMNYVEEAVGIVRASRQARMPVVISFTVETDGNLATGQTLRSAIESVDAATSSYPSYYMINCAHPTHFSHVVAEGGTWAKRIGGLRANASTKSHAELNESTELDIGNPDEFGHLYARLKERLRDLNVLGGCCGTDHRHVEQIAKACAPMF